MSRDFLGVNFKISRFTRLLTAEGTMTRKGSETVAEVSAAMRDGEDRSSQQAAAAEAATAGKGGGGGKAPATGVRNPSQASRDLMANFLSKTPITKRGREDWAASPRPDQAAKRATQRGEEEDRGGDNVQLVDMEDMEKGADEPWQAKLRQTMIEAAGITPEQANICMQHIKKTFQDRVAEEAKRVAKKVFRDEVEAAKCRRSILMHNADKWVASDQATFGYNLAERVTVMVHRISGGMLNVVDCFTVGAWQEGRMPSSVYLSFGSAQQKSTFFRIMANRIRFGNEAARSIRVLACRDAFPKEHIPEAKRLAQKGMGLRTNGEVASFRVVARGLGCIPVLEVRERMTGGQTARWGVYQDMAEQGEDGDRAAGEATPVRGQAATGEEEWQVAGGRRKTGRNESRERRNGSQVRGTPNKVAGGTGRLSVPQPGTILPTQREEEMEADEIVRFPEGTDMERYEEPY